MELLRRMLEAERIAVVGVSDDPSKPSHVIAKYLIDAGYEVFPVNPHLKSVLGRPCYASLKLVPGHIDLVNVFRRPEYLPGVVADAIYVNAGGVWVQSGLSNPTARRAADAAEMDYIEDRCIMVEHQRMARLDSHN
jgi:predicted CoA-binding protein